MQKLKINTRHFEVLKNQITQDLYWQKQLYTGDKISKEIARNYFLNEKFLY
jgi:hypothetical protein